MIGRTNAGSSGSKVLTGTFTASTDSTQRDFLVYGLTFNPKSIVIKRTSMKNNGASSQGGSLVATAFTHFSDNGTSEGFRLITNQHNGGTAYLYFSQLTITATHLDGGIWKVDVQENLSYTNGSKTDYGTYAYYIYG